MANKHVTGSVTNVSKGDETTIQQQKQQQQQQGQLSTGSMSIWFAAYTLACSQIGSTLVGVSQFMGGMGVVYGGFTATALGIVSMGTIWFLQDVWIHARQHRLGIAPTFRTARRTSRASVEQGLLWPQEAALALPGPDEQRDAEARQRRTSGGSFAGVATEAVDHEQPESRLTYSDLVAHTLRMRCGRGRTRTKRLIKWLCAITVCMQVTSLAGTAVSEVIQTGVNLFILTGLRTPRFWAGLIGGLVMTPLCWLPSFESLSFLSLIGILAVLWTATVVVIESSMAGVQDAAPFPDPTLTTAFTSMSDLVFVWGSGAMVPEVASSMRRPTRLVAAFGLDVVYTLAVLLPTAFVGLWAYRASVSSNILRQLPDNLGTKSAAAFLSVHMIIAFAILLAAVMEGAERLVGLRKVQHAAPQPLRAIVEDGSAATASSSSEVIAAASVAAAVGDGVDVGIDSTRQQQQQQPAKRRQGCRVAQRVVLRTAIALVCVFIGVAFPFFSDLIGVVSAVSQSYLSFLAPSAMWLALFQASAMRQRGCGCRRWGVVLAYSMIVVFTVLGLGLGMWASVVSLVGSISKFGVFAPNQ